MYPMVEVKTKKENLSFNLESEPSNMLLLTVMTIMKRSRFLKRPP